MSSTPKAELLKRAEQLWADLQRNELGGYSGINRPFWIAEQFRQVREDAIATPPSTSDQEGVDPQNGGKAVIEDGHIIIRVAISALPMVVEGSWAAGGMDTRYKVTDPEAFAKDLVYELNEESENGTTRIHSMFDFAIDRAIEQGAEGIERHEEQEA